MAQGLGFAQGSSFRRESGPLQEEARFGLRPDGTFGPVQKPANADLIRANAEAAALKSATQREPSVRPPGGPGPPNIVGGTIGRGRGGGGTPRSEVSFTPTASGLFADAANPFGGQTAQARTGAKKNLLQATQPRGGVPGSVLSNPF